jgi:hypothetical protein
MIGLLLLTTAAPGCHTSAARKPSYPPDPLFAGKQPQEKATGAAGPVAFVSAAPDPRPPLFPQTLLASPSAGVSPSAPDLNSVVRLSSRPREPLEPIPVSRSLGALRKDKAVHEPAYDHAPDYCWLIGTLEKHYEGHFALRYSPATAAEQWGGRVSLEPDPRLEQFQDGDQVRVEGLLLPCLRSAREESPDIARYRIQSIQRAQPN